MSSHLHIDLFLFSVAILISIAGCTKHNSIQTRHSYSDYKATVEIKGLSEPLKVLHISDSHISVLNDSEKRYHPYGARMDAAFNSVHNYKTGEKTTPVKSFLDLMDTAKTEKVDLIVLTGDIVNNPSKSSVRFIHDALQKTAIPYIYVAGNHDWHYEGMEGSASALRRTWIDNSLLPLYNGKNPLYSSTVVHSINFVVIDNSTYQVSEEQLAFYKKQTQLDLPIVLLMHIPLYLHDKDKGRCGDPAWGWDTDTNYEIERRERWPKEGNLPSTMAFVDMVKKSKNLCAILAGHIHKAHEEVVSETAVQYITGASVTGEHRLLIFKPLE